jgi:hypothetical protein
MVRHDLCVVTEFIFLGGEGHYLSLVQIQKKIIVIHTKYNNFTIFNIL